jgi:Na+-transporting methylmalonyl-CoA/oxaloacetate decarboxylase gamma subunit
MPRTFSGEESRGYPQGAIEEYRHPSMIERYRGLAIVFAILSLLLGAYVVKSIVTAKPKPPPPPRPEQSVYIEAVPQKGAPPQNAPSAHDSPPSQVAPPQVAPPQNPPARKGAPPPR